MRRTTVAKYLLVIMLSAASVASNAMFRFPFVLPLPVISPPTLAISEEKSTDGSWTLSWTASAGATTYILEESAGGGAFGEVYRGSGRSKTIEGKRENIEYYYRIKACQSYRCSAASPAKKVRLEYILPSTLSGIPANSASGNFTVRWDSLSVLETIELQRESPGSSGWTTVVGRGRTSSKAQSNLTPGTYSYRLVRYISPYIRPPFYFGRSYPQLRKQQKTEASKSVVVAKPGKPSFLKVPLSTTGDIAITWGQASYATHYWVQQQLAGGGYTNLYQGAARAKTVSPRPGRYRYRVRGCRGGYTETTCSSWRDSEYSKVEIARPAAPSIGGKSALSDAAFSLSWPATHNANSYRLYRYQAGYGSGSYGARKEVYKGASRSVTQSLGDGNYQYRVVACYNNTCSTGSPGINTSVLGKPVAPGGIGIINRSGLTDTDFTVRWNSQTRPVTSYKLYRQMAPYSDGAYSNQSTQTTGAAHLDQKAGDGRYRYQVQACNQAGCGPKSVIVETSVLRRPDKPANLRLVGKDALKERSYSVMWDDQTKRVMWYELSRGVTAYSGDFVNNNTLKVNATSKLFTDNDGRYRFSVRACNDAGCSGYTEVIETRVLAVPDTPAGLQVMDKVDNADTTYSLFWNGQKRRVTQYKVYSSRAAIGLDYGGEAVRITSARELHFNTGDDGDYRYRVQACNEAGCSNPSDFVSTRVLGLPTAPPNLRITEKLDSADGSYVVEWDGQAPRVTSYILHREKATYGSNSYSSQDSKTLPSSTTRVEYADDDGHYRYRVEACNEDSCAMSGWVQTTVLAIPDMPQAMVVPAQSLGAFLATASYGAGHITHIMLQESINEGSWQPSVLSQYQGKPGSIGLTRSAYLAGGSSTLATYRFRMAACNNSGCSDFSPASTSIAIVPPGTPAAFQALTSHAVDNKHAVDSDGTYLLQWQKIDDIDSAGVNLRIHYQLKTNINGAGWTDQLLADDRATTMPLNNMAVGHYAYQLRACLETVGCGDWTHILNVDVKLKPDGIPAFTVPAHNNGDNFSVSWVKPSGTVTRYELQRNEQITATNISGNSTDYGQLALPDGIYLYRLRACNDEVCTDWSDVQTSQVLHTPEQTLFVAHSDSISDGSGSYWLGWLAPGAGQVDYYQLKTSMAANNSWATALNISKESYQYTGSDPDGQYSFTVRACNEYSDGSQNCGPASNPHLVTVLKRAARPSAVTLPAHSLNGSYSISWQAPAGNDIEYQLLENHLPVADQPTGLSKAYSHKPDGNYSYQVRACNSAGCSAYSSISSVHVLHTPSKVQGLTAPGQTAGNNFDLAWQKPATGSVTYYELRRDSDNNNNWINIGNVAVQTLSAATEGDHQFWVRACNELSCGEPAVQMVKVRLVPESPALIEAEGISNSRDYSLSWLAGKGVITNYEVQESQTGLADSTDWTTIGSADALEHKITNQSSGTYHYRVRACNNGNCAGQWSAIKTVVVNVYDIPTAPSIQTVVPPSLPYGSDEVGTTAGQFRVNESGGASYTIALTMAAGTAGVKPELGISYNSQAGNGLLGKGWSLNGLSAITRCRQTISQDGKALPIRWDEQDRFCINGQRLLLTSNGDYGDTGSYYKTEIDNFSYIKAVGGRAGHPNYFQVEGKDGSLTFYGKTADARHSQGDDTYSWSISRFEDSVGNGIDYSYANDASGMRLSQIDYAYGAGDSANAHIELIYEAAPRGDQLSAYIGGRIFRTAKRLTNIKTYNNDTLLRDYRLAYKGGISVNGNSPPTISRLVSIEECAGDGTCLPETRFSWQSTKTAFAEHSDSSNYIYMNKRRYLLDYRFADINGDGLQDLIYVSAYAKLKKRLFKKPKLKSHQTLHYMINTGSGFDHGEAVGYREKIENPLKLQVLDYNADSHQDLLVYRKGDGWELYLAIPNGEGHWSLQRQHGVNIPFTDADMQFADVNGDGLADAMAGGRYWLLERDDSKPVTSNLAYRFGNSKTIAYNGQFDQDRSTYLANDIRGYINNCGWYCGYYRQNTLSVKASAGDINGDGIADFLIQKRGYQLAISDNSDDSLAYTAVTGSTVPAISDHELFRAVDINADGLTDIVYWKQKRNGGSWQLQLSTGTTFTAPMDIVASANADSAEKQAVQLVDMNGDGYPDITWQANNYLNVRYWGANGQPAFGPKQSLRPITINDDTNHIIMDYNGDGVADYIRFAAKKGGHGGTFYYKSSGQQPQATNPLWDAKRNIANVITHITNGLGAVTALEYQRINQSDHYRAVEPLVYSATSRDYSAYNDPFGDLPADAQSLQATPLSPVLAINGPMAVVSRVSSSAPVADNPKAQSHISYHYSEARLQAAGRGSIGFKTLQTVDEQTGVTTTTSYRQDWPFMGSAFKTEVKTAQGNLLSESTNHWTLQGWRSSWPSTVKSRGSTALGPLHPYIAKATEKTYHLSHNGATQGGVRAINHTSMDYDDHGNVSRIVVSNNNGNGTLVQSQTTTNRYGGSEYDKQKGRLSTTSVTVERPGQTTKTRYSSFTYYSSGAHKGLLKTETLQPDGGEAQSLTSTHSYDSYGNKTGTSTQGWDGTATVTRHGPRVVYDSTGRYSQTSYQTYPVLGEKRISQVLSRDRYGNATRIEDALGNRTYSEYSPMGRQYFSASDAGGWKKTWMTNTSNQCPEDSAYVVHATSADGSASQQCHDVIGRPVRKLSTGFDGSWIAADTEYDSIGRVSRSSQPFRANNYAGYWTTIDSYDLLGRPTATTAPDGSQSSSSYQGYQISHTNAAGQTKTESYNSLGEIIQVTDNNYSSADYQHDTAGQLVVMIDSAGNRTELAYDSLGRKLSMNDPDKGVWQYQYNAFGELIKQTNAKGQTSTLAYDLLGRKTTVTDRDSKGHIEQSIIWTFDSQANGLGQLASVSSSDGYQQSLHYDSLGRNHQSTTSLPGAGTFTERQTFDHLGRPYQRFDASSDQQDNGVRGTQTQYNAYGYGEAVVDVRHQQGQPITVYKHITAMDERGQVIGSTQANGLIATSKQYNYATGLLEQVNSQSILRADIQDLRYDWDNIGNLTARHEYSGSKSLSESFAYDSINRLTSAGNTTVQYDSLGNITAKSDVGAYRYGSSAGPHAVTQAGNTTYQYDANGNNISSSDGRTLQYSTFDKVVEVRKGNHQVNFNYSPHRNRYRRIDQDSSSGQTKTTYYLGAVEIIDNSNGQREYKRQLGDAIETIRYQGNSFLQESTHYLLQDHLGSVDVIVDHLGNIEQELSFDAWGKRRNASDWQAQLATQHLPLSAFGTLNSITTRGYTGHEMVDAVGIIHMNGRIYDPKLGRFLQADPFIQAPYNTQSLNRYSYVMNNPLNATDPSGYFWNLVVQALIAYVVSDIIVTIGINSGWSSDLIGALTIATTIWLTGAMGPESLTTTEIAVMATLGGITSVLQGGKFGHGFVSAGLSAIGGQFIKGANWIKKGVGKTVAKITLGGTISKITGGKFANGAAGAAFAMVVQSVGAGMDSEAATTGEATEAYGKSERGKSWTEAEANAIDAQILREQQQSQRAAIALSEGKGSSGGMSVFGKSSQGDVAAGFQKISNGLANLDSSQIGKMSHAQNSAKGALPWQ